MHQALKRVNQLTHTWLGLLLSLWVLLMAVTGTVLYYKPALLKLTYPALNLESPLTLTQAASQLDRLTPPLTEGYAYMPTETTPWLEVVDKAKTRWYFGESGLLLKREQHGDVFDVFVSLHHDLMLGKTGKDLSGIFGLASLLLVITGLLRWWPRYGLSRRHFTIHWFSLKTRKGLQTLSELHKVSAVVMIIPMVVILGTGTAIIYAQPVNQLLVSLMPEAGEQPSIPSPAPQAPNWQRRVELADTLFDGATPRLMYLSKDRMRLKFDDEWHPNGRSYLGFSPQQGHLIELESVRQTATGNQLSHTLYPLHVAAVGGTLYLLISTLAGVTLMILPLTGIAYYLRRRSYRQRR
ncbi:PepSY-associated TM helix domain-containing protein [Lacimicrobium sp. SS2-24]|uniref:PepSY-associated TM helix domain-containing protein n=1 Tax=Lacimicrobium sp. SS2-24 TaxID=2005569 RepID=UPI000B4AE434|nr:PepSY-associated TM helix domain-containing protein [Lacimicrobium sp. SS2-24]